MMKASGASARIALAMAATIAARNPDAIRAAKKILKERVREKRASPALPDDLGIDVHNRRRSLFYDRGKSQRNLGL